jgi:hypothetical protein
MKHLKIIFLIILYTTLNSCDKCKGVACFTPPNAISFKIFNQDKVNISGTIDSPKLVYTDKGVTKEIILQKIVQPSKETAFITSEIAWSSIDVSIAFELKINNVSKGFLRIKESKVNQDCCTYFKISELVFRDKSIIDNIDKDNCYPLVID